MSHWQLREPRKDEVIKFQVCPACLCVRPGHNRIYFGCQGYASATVNSSRCFVLNMEVSYIEPSWHITVLRRTCLPDPMLTEPLEAFVVRYVCSWLGKKSAEAMEEALHAPPGFDDLD